MIIQVAMESKFNLEWIRIIYIEGNIQYPILTPSSMLLDQNTVMLEEDPDEDDDRNSCKCKDAAWR